MSQYLVRPGPEAFLPPAAASMGNALPDPGQAHISGRSVPEEEAFEYGARVFMSAKTPTIFPGPLVLWSRNETPTTKATSIKFHYDTTKACAPARANTMLLPTLEYCQTYRTITPAQD